MDKNEPFVFVLGEEDGETPKQSPGSSQTWPMDKIRQRRFQQKMSSLLSPVTPKRNYSVGHAKSLLLQCLRDSKSDPLPRRRFPASYSDDGILMDGVLVTSATGKKVSGSPSSSLGRSARSSNTGSQHKNTEFSSPKSEAGRNQETTRSQQSSAGKGNMLANSPSTKVETPKAANPSKLQATAQPFILTPRSSQRLASHVPLHQLPYDHQWGNPPTRQQLPSSYGHLYSPPSYAYPSPLQGIPLPYLHVPASPHYLSRSPRPTGYQMPHDLNQSPTTASLPTTPSSSQPNTNTSEPPVHTPISTNPTANLSTSTTTTHGSRLDLQPSVDGLDTVNQKLDLSSPSDGLGKDAKKPDLSSPSDELETMTQKPDLSSPSDKHETVTKKPDLSPSDGLETVTQKPDLTPSAGLQTKTRKKDWSPSDDRLETFPQAESGFTNSHGRILLDDVFEHYKYRKRLPVFSELCFDDKLPQPEPHED